jgi:hypothetical protein
MNVYFYILLIFSITTILYIMGYKPVLFSLTEGYGGLSIGNIANAILNWLFTWQGAVTGIAIVTTAIFMSGMNLYAIIPFILLSLVLNLMLFPMDFINNAGFPAEIGVPIILFFQLSTFIAAMAFVRG